MIDIWWDWTLLAEAASKLKKVEELLTKEQIEYLTQYYSWNKKPSINELKLIRKEWNIKTFPLLFDVEGWFYGHRMAEREIEQRRNLARKLGA